MYDMLPAMEVVISKEAKDNIKRLQKSTKRFNDVYNALKWRVELCPTSGKNILGNIYLLKSYDNTNLDYEMAMCYSFSKDDNKITIYNIKIFPLIPNK